MQYFDGLFFAMADAERDSIKIKQNYPFYYGLQYIHSGKLFLRIDRELEFLVEGPGAFLTWPGSYFEYWNAGEERRRHLWCCFYGSRVEQMISGGLLPITMEKPVFTIGEPELFLHLMQELIALAGTERGHDRAVMRLEELLYLMQESPDERSIRRSPYAEYFEELLAGIEQYPERDWNFSREAAGLHITLNHFNRLFREHCHSSPRHLVISARMRRAAELLLETNDSMREIADAIGLKNEFYFSRLFRAKYHLPPATYRREFCGEAAPEDNREK